MLYNLTSLKWQLMRLCACVCVCVCRPQETMGQDYNGRAKQTICECMLAFGGKMYETFSVPNENYFATSGYQSEVNKSQSRNNRKLLLIAHIRV